MQNYAKQKRKDIALKIVAPVAVVLLFFAIWELALIWGNVPGWVIAKPTDIFKAFFDKFSSQIWPNAWVTLKTILIAFPIGSVLGIAVAGLLTNSVFIANAVTPYIIFLVCTPMMTLVPLLTILLGFGLEPRIIVVILQCFPIVNMNCCVGFLNVPLERRELMMSMKATRLQNFFKITIPSSIPNIFTGLRLGFIVCVTCCIAAEFAGGNSGLGAAIILHTQFIRLPLAFACIFAVAIIGITFYNLISLLEGKIKTWQD